MLSRLKMMVKQVVWRLENDVCFSNFDVCWRQVGDVEYEFKRPSCTRPAFPAICQKRPGGQQ